jgi:transposase
MPKKSTRPKIIISEDDITYLKKIANSNTAEHRKVQRAKIILMNHEGLRDKDIKDKLNIDVNTVRLCLDKCLAMGARAALNDLARKGAPTEICQEDKAWVVYLACERPQIFGYAQETWTLELLIKHIREHAESKGHLTLTTLAKSKLWKILNDTEIKPHKVKYYLEKRDPEFELKMAQILIVYKEINTLLETGGDTDSVTISYDEKPGIQAIENTAPDLNPQPYLYKSIGRDYEYKRHGTVSLLAGVNLETGEITADARDSHKSSDFTAFLDILDERYKSANKIRLILDNHSAHVSKETVRYLEKKPNRFEFVFTPKHGSWLNIIESFFSKLTRVFLRHIRVSSKEELKQRLLLYINEINQDPVILRWKYKMDEIIL